MCCVAGRCSSRTPAEKINEAEAWEELEAKKAKERQGDRSDIRLNLDESEKGRTDEKVAEKVGVSKDTYRNGKKVKEIATGQRDAPSYQTRLKPPSVC